MNKKENKQLKKIEQLDQQLDYTIKNIGQVNVKPIKLNKKKLLLLIIIPFSFACVLSAVVSFLVIDPYHWYTKSYLSLEQQQEKEIKRIKNALNDISIATSLDDSNTVFELLSEIKNNPTIKEIIGSYQFEVISSKKNVENLSIGKEKIKIRVIVKVDSLETAVDIELNDVVIDSKKVKDIKRLFKYKKFLDELVNKIPKADGEKRVSDLIEVIKKEFIYKDNEYKQYFKDITIEITNDKNDNEIIAKSEKTLNVKLSFIENNKQLVSNINLKFEIQGKTREEINETILYNLKNDKLEIPFNFEAWHYANEHFFADTVFANKSTYQDLINEINSYFPKVNEFLNKYSDKTDSEVKYKISLFLRVGKEFVPINQKQLNEIITLSEGISFLTFKIQTDIVVCKEESKKEAYNINWINVLKNDHPDKDNYLFRNKVRNDLVNYFLNYKMKTKIDGKSTYEDALEEVKNEIQSKFGEYLNSNANWYIKGYSVNSANQKNEIITETNLIEGGFEILIQGRGAAFLLYLPITK